jgi:hypothetical protein
LPPAGFETEIPTSERPKTKALNRSTIDGGQLNILRIKILRIKVVHIKDAFIVLFAIVCTLSHSEQSDSTSSSRKTRINLD